MNEDPKPTELQPETSKKLKLYIYGSCESDQYYHPRGDSESKRPICLSDIENFNMAEYDDDQSKGPTIIPNPFFKQEILKIACGALHTIVVTTEGSVYTFGCNDEGALGRQGFEKIPIKVPLEDPIDLISAGDNHSVFANSFAGSIYFTGNYRYMRGQSMGERITSPIRYEMKQLDSRLKNTPIQKVVSGSNHSAVVAGGKIFIRGQPEAHTVGRRINARHKVSNSLNFDGLGLNKVEDLWCGGYHNIAKIKKGSTYHYYVWGLNKHGQLGLRTYEDAQYPQQLDKFKGVNIVDVAAGTNFTIVLTEEGQVYGCGQNDSGQLGLGQDYIYQDSEDEGESENEVEKQVVQEKKQMQEKQNDEKMEIQKIGEKGPEDIERNENKVLPEKKLEQDKVISQEKVEEKPILDKAVEERPLEEKVAEEKLQLNNSPIEQREIQKEEQQLEKKEEPKVDKAPEEQKNNEVPKQIECKPDDIPQNPQKKMEEESPIKAVNPKLKEENIYIKSFKKLNFSEKIQKITSGAQFSFGWNQESLYSWGFGYNFVLLNGEEEDEVTPFKIRSKILNEHSIYDVAAGAQHVAYLSYPPSQEKPQPKLSEAALESSRIAKKSLTKKKKV